MNTFFQLLQIDQVEKFVAEVNVAMRHREESRLMSKLMNRIESYDAVEAPNEECIKVRSRSLETLQFFSYITVK